MSPSQAFADNAILLYPAVNLEGQREHRPTTCASPRGT